MNAIDVPGDAALYVAHDLAARPSLVNSSLWLLSWGEGSDQKTMEVRSPGVAGIIMSLQDEVTLTSLDKELAPHVPSPSARQKMLGYWLRHGLLLPERPQVPETEHLWDRLAWHDALVFHRATRNIRWRHEYPPNPQVLTWYNYDDQVLPDAPRPEVDYSPRVDAVPLPNLPPGSMNVDGFEVMGARRTARNFGDSAVTLGQAGELLHWVFRPIIQGKHRKYYTTLSSADGWRVRHELHPLTVYALFETSRKPPELPNSTDLYRYNPVHHSLEPVTRRVAEGTGRFSDLLWGQDFADRAPLMLVLGTNWSQLMWKYRTAYGYRLTQYDLGAYMQTAMTVATALGLRAFLTPAINDDRLTEMLDCAEGEYAPAYILAVGARASGVSDEQMLDIP